MFFIVDTSKGPSVESPYISHSQPTFQCFLYFLLYSTYPFFSQGVSFECIIIIVIIKKQERFIIIIKK